MKKLMLLLLALLLTVTPALSLAEAADMDAAFEQAKALYQSGDPAAQSALEALAAQGHAESMFYLGYACAHGVFSADQTPDFAAALDWYLRAAEAGSNRAMNNLGTLYHQGSLTDGTADHAAAFDWYTRAAENGNTNAMVNLADGWRNGCWSDGTPDPEQAHSLLLKASELGSGRAAYKLAEGYVYGDWADAPDANKALEWYQRAIEAGNVDAADALASFYMSGKDAPDGSVLFEKDYAKALPMLEKALEMGSTSINTLSLTAWFCEGNSDLMEPDFPRAVQLYQQAVDQDYLHAANQLAHLYLTGKTGDDGAVLLEKDCAKALPVMETAVRLGTDNTTILTWLAWFCEGSSDLMEPDHARALELYLKASDLNDVYATNAAARICIYGRTAPDGATVIAPDYAKALPLLQKALQLGTEDTNVLAWLGWFYAGNSDLMEADYFRAAEVYQKAANLGDAYSMNQLASIYRDGRLGEVDRDKAIEYFTMAIEAGSTDAQAALDAMLAE